MVNKEKQSVFSERLKTVRKIRDITQQELIKTSGIRTIAHFEGGKRNPSIKNLKKLCEVLKVSADYLLGISEYPFDTQGQDSDAVKMINHLSKRDFDTITNLLVFLTGRKHDEADYIQYADGTGDT